MLNAMAPNGHHLQSGGGESPILLAASSSPSPSITTVSSSPSSASMPPKQQQQTTTTNTNAMVANDCDEKSSIEVHQNTVHNQATNTATSDTKPDIKSNKMHKSNDNNNSSSQLSHKQYNPTTKSTFRNQYETTATKAPITTNSSNRVATTQSNQNHYSFPNNNSLYHSSRFSHHNQFSSNSKHSLSYAARSSNQQRGHNNSNQKQSNSYHNHNHQHNHYNQQHHNSSTYGNSSDNHNHHHHHRQDLPLPFTTASSSSSLPGSDVTSSNSSVANQQATTCGPPHYVDLHVNAGECVSLQLLDGQEQVLTGPATITMISQQQNPPVPIPVQVPPGHMVHQIADENGTLKHIILSVMNGEENSHFDSTVIDLPHGSFRINSLGELVSVSGNLTGNENDVVRHEGHMPLNAPQLDTSVANATNYHSHQLPQHQTTTYYANYDGCPVANYATQDNSNIIESQQTDSVDQQSKQSQDDTSSVTDTRARTSSSSNSRSFDKSKDALSNIADTKQPDDKTTLKNTNEASDQDRQDSEPAQDESQTLINKEQSKESDPSMVISSSAQQMVAGVPSSSSETVYPQHTIITGQTDIDPTMLTSGTLPGQMMTGAALDDQQLYCYPACCCCCYCSPDTSAAMDASGQHQQAPVLGPQPGSIMMVPAPIEQPASATACIDDTNTGRLSNRGGHSQTDGGAYNSQQGHHMIVQGGVGMNVPLSLSNTSPMVNSQSLHSLTGQNGLVPLHSSGKGVHYPDVNSHTGAKSHKLSRGGSNTGAYKQHKSHSGSTSGAHGSVYHQKYGSQSYNNIVSGQSLAYHQDSNGSPASYKPPQSLMSSHSNQTGAYPPIQASYDQPTTLAHVVSGGKHHPNTQQQNYLPHSTGHRNDRDPNGEHINSTQRSSRIDQHTSNSHMTNTGGANIYGISNNSGYIRGQQQHHGEQQSKRHPASLDKNSNRYHGSANGRVMINNHATIGNGGQYPGLQHQTNSGTTSNASSIGGSVSPFRLAAGRSKAGHNQSTPPNGLRYGSSAFYPNAMHGDLAKENAILKPSSPKNLFVSTHDDQSISNQSGKHVGDSTSSPMQHKSANSWQQVQKQANSGKGNNYTNPTESSNHRQGENVKKQQQQQHQHGQQDAEITNSRGSVVTSPDQSKGDHSAARASRGKQKKLSKEPAKQPSDGTGGSHHPKRQHSNDGQANEGKKNQRPKSTNESTSSQRLQEDRQTVKGQDRTSNSNKAQQQQKQAQKRVNSNQDGKQKAQVTSSRPTTNTAPNEVQQQPQQVSKVTDGAHVQEDSTRHPDVEDAAEIDQSSALRPGDGCTSDDDQKTSKTSDDAVGGDIESGDKLQLQKDKAPSKTSPSGSQSNIHTSKGESPARRKSKSSSNNSSKSSSPKSEPAEIKIDAGSGNLPAQGESTESPLPPPQPSIDNDILIVSEIDAADGSNLIDTTSGKSAYSVSMRTSLSENNIQSLEVTSSLNAAKSTQTTPQKQANPAAEHEESKLIANEQLTTNETTMAAKKKSESSPATIMASTTSKRKTSNGKTEQQFRLNSLPQVKLLNLNCVSVTSSSVCLRWSYVTSLADKYGIHQHYHHHHGSKHHLYDHFVVESSSSKNADTNTLISPKITYQGCAMTCRINHLTPEKVYHFRIRRTALVSSEETEHLAVSEILSVTLPSIQSNSNNSNNKEMTKKTTALAGGDHQSIHPLATSSSSSSSSARGNTSSQTNVHHGSGNTKSTTGTNNHNHHPIKLSHLGRQCRNKVVATLGSIMQNSLSSCSDTKFAGLLLMIFTIFAMLLAIFIHYYIVAPVNE